MRNVGRCSDTGRVTPLQLVTFAGVALVLVAVPGPAVLFVVGRTFAVGRRGAAISEIGLTAGSLLQVGLVAVGVGALIAASDVAFTVVKLLGAAYLVVLGVRAILGSGRALSASASERARPAALVRQGFVVGASNPKTVVFLAAVLPQFVVPGPVAVPLQLGVLGLELVVVGAASDLLWMLVAGRVRRALGGAARRQRALEAGGGLIMIALGGVLALGRRV